MIAHGKFIIGLLHKYIEWVIRKEELRRHNKGLLNLTKDSMRIPMV